MKKTIIILISVVLPIISISQARLGNTAKQIESFYPNNTFKSDVTNGGNKYISTETNRGTFSYYFDSTGLSYLCTLIPNDLYKLNEQVQELNHEYVIINDTTWKAYLDGGSIMSIKLIYNSEYNLSVFKYGF